MNNGRGSWGDGGNDGETTVETGDAHQIGTTSIVEETKVAASGAAETKTEDDGLKQNQIEEKKETIVSK